MEYISVPDICSRIALQSPYFALESLERHGDTAVVGHFDAEHDIGRERGPVSVAELYRHLAVLGSCAAALAAAPAPKYYLASKGKLNVLRTAHGSEADGKIEARSEVLSQDKKSLVTH